MSVLVLTTDSLTWYGEYCKIVFKVIFPNFYEQLEDPQFAYLTSMAIGSRVAEYLNRRIFVISGILCVHTPNAKKLLSIEFGV